MVTKWARLVKHCLFSLTRIDRHFIAPSHTLDILKLCCEINITVLARTILSKLKLSLTQSVHFC